jgi:predicted dienelactone hydrolase
MKAPRLPVGLLPILLLLCVVPAAHAAPSWNVGYRKLEVQDPLTGEPFPVALWYPTSAEPAPLFVTDALSPCGLPAMLCRWIAFEMMVAPSSPPVTGRFGLIVISHGAGGLAVNHRDLAMVLASQGYVVAAPTHPRGQSNDVSGPEVWIGRPKQISRVIDTLLEDGALKLHIDGDRIGVVGHSNGGYTALAVAGAIPSVDAALAHCQQHPDDARFCAFGGPSVQKATRAVGQIPDLHDPRVRSIVLMAPTAVRFTDAALARVAVPVLVYAAEKDDLTVLRYNGDRLVRTLPYADCVLVKGAGHFSFVAGFPMVVKIIAGEAARDPAGFDREAFHRVMNRDVVEFFDRTLRPERSTPTRTAQPPSCQ